MNNADFKKLLENSTKEQLVQAVVLATRWMPNFRDEVVRELKIIERKEREDKEQEISQKHTVAMNEYFEANKKYNIYIFEVGRKHNIVKKNEKGVDTFNWGEWFNSATQEEKDKALLLEKDMSEKFKLYQKLDKEWLKTLHD